MSYKGQYEAQRLSQTAEQGPSCHHHLSALGIVLLRAASGQGICFGHSSLCAPYPNSGVLTLTSSPATPSLFVVTNKNMV